MVRKGSRVQVPERALQKPRESGVSSFWGGPGWRASRTPGMAIDASIVGRLAAQMMDELAQLHPDGRIDAIAFVAAVDAGDGTTTVRFQFADGEGGPLPRWQGLGLLAEVQRAV